MSVKNLFIEESDKARSMFDQYETSLKIWRSRNSKADPETRKLAREDMDIYAFRALYHLGQANIALEQMLFDELKAQVMVTQR